MQRLAIALTVINLVVLVLAVTQIRSTLAQGTAQVIRGAALELVDERGVVRARLAVKRPSTVVELDLFDKNGINHVKLGAGENGSGLLLTDETTGTATSYVQIIARRTGTPETPKTTSITLKGSDGRERVLTPP
ncbi:MAG TPA: hypothetical protein VGR24_11495 [bacterium]|jgi:hypothetical protein|nr:hypothetical protein [bacterium]